MPKKVERQTEADTALSSDEVSTRFGRLVDARDPEEIAANIRRAQQERAERDGNNPGPKSDKPKS
ncbi:hypothetical protein [Devosia neptuniae]|jgi:hypothetical protein|uniref:hypothetical protein n=1 Tax=Devosia neptuniae TaxID=191302 RepID=UPI0022B07B3C|nr:hypothetical protein [Devosia neptuniae]MCZ4345006.1 hypothetical protein [Devosia neptuniae]|tara:strand:- start:4020 stop:4214 length:195 start_codon:yes stop_codon:yes gene_type:complete